MATAKRKPRTKKSEARKEPCEQNPLSWLYLNPQPAAEGTAFGVLRKTFGGRTNSAHEFGYRKTHLGPDFAGSDLSNWSPNAERVEVILPSRADDFLSDPDLLLRQADSHAAPNEAALLTYWTLPLTDCERMHVAWERVRSFATRIASERELASVIVLHSPGLIGTDFPLHAHLLILPRRLRGLGVRHAPYDQPLVHDEGQTILSNMWEEHRGEGG